jgi:hypothetical protein
MLIICWSCSDSLVFYCLSLSAIFDWMLELFRQCGILLFVSVSMIFYWMLELFRQCGRLLFVSVSMIFEWMLELFRQCDIYDLPLSLV